MGRSIETLRRIVERFVGNEPIKAHLVTVLAALPSDVQDDLLDDTRFRIALDDYAPGRGRTVWMSPPQPGGSVSRCIVLKHRLTDGSADFARYVIAHELAHAFLRNGAWADITDPERAADALAASWGFECP